MLVPSRFPEAVDRLARCGAEYQQTVSGWETLLASHSNTEPDALTEPGSPPR